MIRHLLLASMMLWFGTSHATDANTGDKFDFQSIEVSTAISLYLKEVTNRPYMLCGDVLADTRKVSIRASGKALTGPLFSSLLDDHGFEAVERGGVLVVCKKTSEAERQSDLMVYRVKHRDPAYLIDLVSPLVKGTFANKRSSLVGALSVGGEKVGGTTPVQRQLEMPVTTIRFAG